MPVLGNSCSTNNKLNGQYVFHIPILYQITTYVGLNKHHYKTARLRNTALCQQPADLLRHLHVFVLKTHELWPCDQSRSLYPIEDSYLLLKHKRVQLSTSLVD